MVRFFCLLLVVNLAFAKIEVEVIDEKIYDIFKIESFLVESKNKKVYKIFKATPKDGFENVLVMLDANAQFPMLLNLYKDTNLKKPIIYGIGYDANRSEIIAKRTFDLTPNSKNPDDIGGGGASEFYGFLKDELIPSIKKDTKNREISFYGHSFGGLFSLYALLQNNQIFDEFFIASPSLWWDDSRFLKNVIENRKFKDIKGVKFVKVSVGSLENRKGKTDRLEILKANDLAKILAENLINTEFKLYENHTHGSVMKENFKDLIIHFDKK